MIIVTMGDPSGVGTEIILKAFSAGELPRFCVVGDAGYFEKIAKALRLKCAIKQISQLSEYHAGCINVVHMPLPCEVAPGVLNFGVAGHVLTQITTAYSYVQNSLAKAMVTMPISKEVLYRAGFKFPGLTEYIASLTGEEAKPVMMLANKKLRVVPLTTHLPLKEVSAALTADLIIEKIQITCKALLKNFGMMNPRMAVLGLNPHAGEAGLLGTEEVEIVKPVIDHLTIDGANIRGPFPADGFFANQQKWSAFDVIFGMYHDQVLIPVKMIDFHGTVNITLGLKVIRVSPDHGVALDIAGKGTASTASFEAALIMANDVNLQRSI